jgi:N-acetyl sugar amidotransferase
MKSTESINGSKSESDNQLKKMNYCSRCVYPGVAATPLTFDQNGVCSGCRTHEEQKSIDWDKRRVMFEKIIDQYRSKDKSNYDVLIAVSGGKDSFYQAHIFCNVYGLKALFVCYAENNHTDVGMRNIQRMREHFKGDFLHFTPEINTLKKLNRLAMLKMGDPNWHTHIGIMTLPIIMASKFNVILFNYGEHGFMNLGGMYTYKDMVEFTKKYRTEQMCRGYDWSDFCEETEGLTAQDFLWAKYPSDDTVRSMGLRGVFISNYFGWKPLEHMPMLEEKYGFESAEKPFDRTYRRDCSLNDIHDNGIHDYLKYVKFGYGRATDHVCRDIRNGKMTRTEGIKMVMKYDHVIPNDLERWVEYVGWTKEKFHQVADTFRDSRVWRKNKKGEWEKDNIND